MIENILISFIFKKKLQLIGIKQWKLIECRKWTECESPISLVKFDLRQQVPHGIYATRKAWVDPEHTTVSE